jgi:opacity protein-like surface antigen
MRKVALLPALFLLVGASAFAETLPDYAVAKLGMYLPQATDVEDLDNSFYGELAFGHYFNPNFAVEFGVGWTKPDGSASVDVEISPGVFSSISANVDLTIIPITLGLKGALPMGNFEPYAMGGIGLYYAKAEVSGSVSGIGSASISESDTAFGYYLGLGANFNLSKEVFVGLEGKYFWAKPNFEGEDVKIDGINVTGNIGYRF